MSYSIKNTLIITGLHTSVEVCQDYIAGPTNYFGENNDYETWPFSLDAIYPVPLNQGSYYEVLGLLPTFDDQKSMILKNYQTKKNSIANWNHVNAKLWLQRIETAYSILSSPVQSKLYTFEKSELERQRAAKWKTQYWGTMHDVHCFRDPKTRWDDSLKMILGIKSELGVDGQDGLFTIQFETSYYPPTPALNYLAQLFPTLHIMLQYSDEYNYNLGEYEIKNGIVVKNITQPNRSFKMQDDNYDVDNNDLW